MADTKFEEWFVTRKEYYEDRDEIMKRFHEQDLKFKDVQNDNKQMLKDLNDLPETFKNLNTTLKNIDERVTSVEGISEGNTDRLDELEGSLKTRSDQNVKILGYAFTFLGVLVTAALAFAQVFFQ